MEKPTPPQILRNRRELLRLLKEVKEAGKGFNMGQWAKGLSEGKPTCNTSACMLGWMCLDPYFMKKGLFIDQDDRPMHKVERDALQVAEELLDVVGYQFFFGKFARGSGFRSERPMNQVTIDECITEVERLIAEQVSK